jgi:hypothetical protein
VDCNYSISHDFFTIYRRNIAIVSRPSGPTFRLYTVQYCSLTLPKPMNFTPLCLLEEQGICILAKGTDTLPFGREANLCVYTPSLSLSLSLFLCLFASFSWTWFGDTCGCLRVRTLWSQIICTDVDTEMVCDQCLLKDTTLIERSALECHSINLLKPSGFFTYQQV